MVIDVADLPTLDMLGQEAGEGSKAVAARVAAARRIQKTRFAGQNLPIHTNAALSGEALHRLVSPDVAGKALLEEATEKLRLSMRGYTRVLRVSRTIADLAGSEGVSREHIAEALSYRQMQFGRQVEAA